jgi:Holliday junction resolvase RusA-like endonuclease
MTWAEQVAALVRLGVPREKAESFTGQSQLAAGRVGVEVARAAMSFPVTLTLVWSALCSDNYRFKASMVNGSNGEKQPRLVHDARYATARDRIEHAARKAVNGAGPVAVPLELHARVWTPGGRVHDVVNFAKVVHDSLEKIVYENDRWLHRVVWENVGVDIDAPRAEITITPL